MMLNIEKKINKMECVSLLTQRVGIENRTQQSLSEKGGV